MATLKSLTENSAEIENSIKGTLHSECQFWVEFFECVIKAAFKESLLQLNKQSACASDPHHEFAAVCGEHFERIGRRSLSRTGI
jgi:hypothetical protein